MRSEIRHDPSQKIVMYLGLFASSSCCILGYPCSNEASVILAFRATCVGYFICNLAGLLLQKCELSRRILRIGLVINSLSSWLVSGHWCLGFGEWCIFMLCEHAFMMFGGMVLVENLVHLHLLFTLTGSFVCYLLRRESSVLGVEADRVWDAAAVTVVMVLVGGILYSGQRSISFLRQKLDLISSIVTMSEQELPNSVSFTRTPSGSKFVSSWSSPNGGSGALPELSDCIGRGSFGQVFSANYKNQKAAVKIMTWEGEQLKRVDPLKEAKLCMSMVHPNLVQAFDFFMRDCESELPGKSPWKEIWIVQEWCDRGTLNSYCDVPRTSGLGLKQAKTILCDISTGCEYLHSKDIIHGDLTSNNVLLKSRDSTGPLELDFVCKVCDFGLARVLEEGVSTLLTSQLGTVSHMPPELIRLDNKRLTKKADIYAVGILLYQVLLGRLPFAKKSAPQVVIFVASGKRLQLDETAPEDVRQIFMDCTALEPRERPTAEELVQYFSRDDPQSG
ncbi:Frk [Symbiodinium natans]|uniref:Frk protein n=1 Tax=Symbiodinium natans TaxID=878477 RepID=A0A812K8M9_9DINO|nr:Frk [Symbiodinium natans]